MKRNMMVRVQIDMRMMLSEATNVLCNVFAIGFCSA